MRGNSKNWKVVHKLVSASSILHATFLLYLFSFTIPATESAIFKTRAITSSRKLLNLNALQQQYLSFRTAFTDDSFIIGLISQERFSQCSLVALHDCSDNSESVNRILHNVAPLAKSAYSILYRLPDPLQLTRLDHELKRLRMNLGGGHWNVTEALMSRDALPLHFAIDVSNFRRRSDPCQIVVLMLTDTRPAFMKQIFNLISPVYIPLTRKDEDFFIFKTPPGKHKNLLLMEELPNRTKFKIAVGVENNALKVSTICFFCGARGSPRFVQFPVNSQNLPADGFNYFPDFVLNLNGKLLHVSFPYIRSKVEADPPWEGTMNAKRGVWKACFEEYLMVKFNFTYHMFAASGSDGHYGGGGTGLQLDNGTWTGVTGDLMSGKADLGIAIANTPLRIKYIDFCDSLFSIVWLTFVTAEPSRVYSPSSLIWPFDWSMWTGMGASIVLCILIFFLSFKAMQLFRFGSGEKWSLSVQIQFLLSVILEQDSEVLPRSSALRTFVSLWLLYTMILTTVYRCKMTTFLAFPVLGVIPKTFEQLTFSDYKVGFMKHGDSAYNTLAASTDPVYLKLVAEMELFYDYGLECIENAVKYKYGCIGYDSSMVHVIERNLSEADTQKLVFAPATTYSIGLGMGTEGKSIYRLNFARVLRYTRPFHLVDIWDKRDMYYNVRLPKLKWWKDTGQMWKARPSIRESNNLGFKHIVGAFYVLLVCLIVSCTVFIIEIVRFHGRKLGKYFEVLYWAASYAALAFRNHKTPNQQWK